MQQVDYLIVGQGIAGTMLAWQALQRGKSFCIVDREGPSSASRVAAGLINPLGPRLAKVWRVEETLPMATNCYRNLESKLKADFFHQMPIARVLKDEGQAARWQKRRDDPEFSDWWRALPERFGEERMKTSFGAFETLQGGWLDLPLVLDRSKASFQDLRSWKKGEINVQDLRRVGDRVQWEGVSARWVIFCQGYQNQSNSLFGEIPIRSARGNILRIEAPGLPRSHILHRGNWMIPVGAGNEFRVGSNYDWESQDLEPMEGDRAEIETALREWVQGEWKILGHQVGIRPMANRGKPILGPHPNSELPAAVFNALGSRGVLNAPFFASHLLDVLEGKAVVDPEVDVSKFLL